MVRNSYDMLIFSYPCTKDSDFCSNPLIYYDSQGMASNSVLEYYYQTFIFS